MQRCKIIILVRKTKSVGSKWRHSPASVRGCVIPSVAPHYGLFFHAVFHFLCVGRRLALLNSVLGVCCCCCCCCWEGAATAPVATLLSLHPDRDIIASRVSAALLRAHTAAIGTAAAAHRACSTTHPSTKSGIRSNSRVPTSDAHFGIKPCFCCFSSPHTPTPASGPFPPHRHWLTAWTFVDAVPCE